MKPVRKDADFLNRSLTVVSRAVQGHQSRFRLSDGTIVTSRRFIPLGKGDAVFVDETSLWVYVKKDDFWIEMKEAWQSKTHIKILDDSIGIAFKEIETLDEWEDFESLRGFHYRGGGGAGRTVPLIGVSDKLDIPKCIGFIEVSSSMIANTARKRFFDYPYVEPSGMSWKSWDRSASQKYSNTICRISRFVIHPELRGLGIAQKFTTAAREFAKERWHYGGYLPRFLEITADMLKYYPFVDSEFASMGETEGNEHRLQKDMNYLVRKALARNEMRDMPQGGGGIMTLQRSYARQLLRFAEATGRSTADVIESLRYDPAALDQETWEALFRLNRRPKPCYVSGLSREAKEYVNARRRDGISSPVVKAKAESSRKKVFGFKDISISANSPIAQTTKARILQDAFGFVGSEIETRILRSSSFSVLSGEVTLIAGASGSGKTVLANHIKSLCEGRACPCETSIEGSTFHLQGSISSTAKVATLRDLPLASCPIDLVGKAPLEEFLSVAGRCGLAEPQLFVRPVSSLSSGQRYRLQVALAALEEPDVLIIDNFCEPLDFYTSYAVCKGLRALASERRFALVVATAAYKGLKNLLMADQCLMLRRGSAATTLRGGYGEI